MARGAEDMVERRDGVSRESGEIARRSAWLGARLAGRVAPVWTVASLMLLALAGVCAAADSAATVPARTGKLPA